MGLLEGKVAFVTGAASGIGKAAAERFASEGAKIAVADTTDDDGRAVAERIGKSGGEALYVHCDVSSPRDVAKAIADTVRRFGRLDVVFANAGVNGVWAPIDELAPEEWDATIATNLRGSFLTLRYAVPHLKRAGGGSVVLVSSINGTRVFSNAGATAYSCSKAGQVALAKMAALELARHRIRVNVVCPGAIETEIGDNTEARHREAAEVPAEHPAGDVPLTGGAPGRAQDVAELVLFLASDRARHVTGTPVWIDGAQSLLVG